MGASRLLDPSFSSQTKSVPHTPSSHRTTGLRTKILPAYAVHLHHKGQNYDTQNLQREFWHNYPHSPSGKKKKKKTFTLECKQMFSGEERWVLTWNVNDCLWGDTFSKSLLRNKLLLGLKDTLTIQSPFCKPCQWLLRSLHPCRNAKTFMEKCLPTITHRHSSF